VDGDELSKGIAVADLRVSGLSRVLEVLTSRPNGREGIKFVVFADGDWALKDQVRVKATTGTDLDLVPNNAIGADFYLIPDFGLGRDDCGGMDHGKEVSDAEDQENVLRR
jgi:hypothetical protein